MGTQENIDADRDAKRFIALYDERERKHNKSVKFWKVFGVVLIIAIIYGAWRLFMLYQ